MQEADYDTEQNLTSKFHNQQKVAKGTKEGHKFYGYIIGKLKNPSQLSTYQINDPNSEAHLQNADFDIKDVSACFQEKSLEVFFHKEFTTNELQTAIQNYTEDGAQYIQFYKDKAKNNVSAFMKKFNVEENYAYGCCMALSYYTGSQSQRISRTCNIIIKLYVKNSSSKIKQTNQYEAMRCIGQWLFRALNCIQLHWGQVTRCVNLDVGQYKLYQPGNIVTWLQFSSSSYGQITSYFAIRNTRFIIYSLSGRCIEDFSNYKNASTETEVLFKPFSHFLVLKRKTDGPVQYIYMRQIFIGQSKRNVLWVDDNIFDSNWENKKIMEKAIIKCPLLNIVPKVSTECALAFLKSQIGKNRNQSQFRIITDMNRLNEMLSANAGARFVSACKKMNLKYDIMIFTSNKEKAQQMLKELNVSLNKVKISVVTAEALNFLDWK